ncbi:hypothetical protein [Deinococcus hopiensis]|uniref:Uncharacterized protein n=1 Tax=Deinococcus hopiensis KR-140 TaxID=695939 RepID=A0A1W1V7G7_9DEIO|nr:hypothetical protein [Deinococcus hopiensis]SMB89329.1 hypothetical protein SAMN00790413_00364 [Deinococcus hopiensis KR-140]
MQVLSRVVVILGVLVTLGAVFLLFKNVIDINQLHAVANANRGQDYPSPTNNVLLMTALALVGGFLAGLGVRLAPRRSAPH